MSKSFKYNLLEGGINIKKLIVLLFSLFLLVGCNKNNSENIIKELENKINNSNSYFMSGQMDIISNEEIYKYDVEVSYLKDDYYKSLLKSKDNDYEQIIIRNNEGVFVVTPSLNKSIKLQSEWPFNSSQAYILQSLIKDLKNDSNSTLEKENDDYILYSTVNYPNDSTLVSQKITLDKDKNPNIVEVIDKDGNIRITFKISKINYESEITKDDFDVSKMTIVNENTNENTDENVSAIDQIVYPMYLPTGTVFKSEETIGTDDSQRVILTFSGDKSFTLIEEASKNSKEFEITTVSGELVSYEHLIATLNGASLNWNKNGMDYYLISDNLTNEELLKIASSTKVVSITK